MDSSLGRQRKTLSLGEIEARAADALRQRGFDADRLKMDGTVFRFAVEGDSGADRTGWGIVYADEWANMVLGNWREGEKEVVPLYDERTPLSLEERHARDEAWKRQKEARREARRAEAEKAAGDAFVEWAGAPAAGNDFGYIKRKGIKCPAGVKILQCKRPDRPKEPPEPALIVPLCDASGTFKSYQRIFADGFKAHYPKAEAKGAFFEIAGRDSGPESPVFVCEGMATGSTTAEAWPSARVFCACDCNNIWHVLEGLKAAGRPVALIVGDNDWSTARNLYAEAEAKGKAAGKTLDDFNPGKTKASKAASAFGVPWCVVVQDGCAYPNGKPCSDANDLYMAKAMDCMASGMNEAEALAKGLETVRHALAQAMPAPKTMKFMSRDEALRLPTLTYIVKGLIPDSGVGQLYGPPACGKSFMLLALCHHVAEGWDFYGRRVKRRPVWWLCLEGAGGLSKRLKAFDMWIAEARKPPLSGEMHFSISEFDLADQTQVDALATEITAAGSKGAMVVVDTQSQASTGLDENASKDMGIMLRQARRLAQAIEGVVVLVHHTGKDESRGSRGSNTQLGNLDFLLSAEMKVKGYPVLKTAKEKDESDEQELRFALKTYEVGTDDDGDPITSCVAVQDASLSSLERFNASAGGKKKMAPATIIAWRALETVMKEQGVEDGGAVDKDLWKAEFIRRYMKGEEKSKKSEFYRQCNLLASEGAVIVDGDLVSFFRPSISKSPGE